MAALQGREGALERETRKMQLIIFSSKKHRILHSRIAPTDLTHAV